jgi:hypothetical protein
MVSGLFGSSSSIRAIVVSGLGFRVHLKHRAKICQVCAYEEIGEVQTAVDICLAHSARLCTRTHPHITEAGLVRVDDGC